VSSENNGAAENWVIVLLGARTLLGKLTERTSDLSFAQELSPVYQIEMRSIPQQQIDPVTRQPTVVMMRARNISLVAEMDGFDSLALPEHGIVVKPLSELAPAIQAEMMQAVKNIDAAVAANKRKLAIDEQAATASKGMSFGGGARRE
jgi:hypothetical protein